MMNHLTQWWRQGDRIWTSPPKNEYRWLSSAWLVLLFLAGNLLWARFLNWGEEPLMFHDWSQITGPRLTFLQNAIREGVLPLHAGNTGVFTGDSSRFQSTADVILSPQVLLLRFLDQGPFVVAHTCLLFSLGYVGLLRIRAAQKLSLLSFTAVFLLFFFNGHIVDHLGVGHLTWGGYFLLTWFVYLILELLAGRKGGWSWTLGMSVLLFAVLLQGAYHQFAWALGFLLLLGLARPRCLPILLRTILFSVLASLVRLLPAVLSAGKVSSQYMGGYYDFFHLMSSLVTLQYPNIYNADPWTGVDVGTWELSNYVGLVGAGFLIFFGLWHLLRNRDPHEESHSILLLPCLGIVILSLSQVYQLVFKILPFAPFNGERITSRMASLPLIFIIVLAGIQFQKWLDHRQPDGRTLVLSGVALGCLGLDLMTNMLTWQVTAANQAFGFFGYTKTQWFVQNDYQDTIYLRLILIGLAVTIGTFAFLGSRLWVERRQARNISDPS